jgi:hypothetical protein
MTSASAPTRRPSGTRLQGLLTAGAAVLMLAACSSSPSGTGTSGTTGGTGTATTVPSAARSAADIKRAFTVLFNLADPAVAPKLAVVQDGSALRATFAKALKSALAKEAHGATVLKLTMLAKPACQAEALPSPCAKVVYDILAKSGKVLLADSVGFAVYQPPTWKVSKVTICTLLTLDNGNIAPAGC